MPDRIELEQTWLYNPKTTKLSAKARDFLLRFKLTASDEHTSYADPIILRNRLYPTETRIRVSDVASWLHACIATGALAVYESGSARYAVIAEDLVYRKGKKGKPKFPVMPDQNQQGEFILPAPDSNILPYSGAYAYSNAGANSGDASEGTLNVSPPSPRSPGTRETPAPSGGKKTPGSVQVSNEEVDDLLAQIRAIAGDNEIPRNSGMWAVRIQESRRAVLHALEDWKVRTPDSRWFFTCDPIFNFPYMAALL